MPPDGFMPPDGSFDRRIVALRKAVFTICYGDEDAARLMAERAVERHKLLDAVVLEGKEHDQVERELIYWDRFDSLDEATQCREQIQRKIRDYADVTRALEREMFLSGSDRVSPSIAKSSEMTARCEELLPEAIALENELEIEIVAFETKHGKPEPRKLDGIVSPAPRTLILSNVDFISLEETVAAGLRLLYQRIFGEKQAEHIITLPERERIKAVEEFDVRAIASSNKALQRHLISCRDVAVNLITIKNRLTMVVAQIESIVDDIPSDTDDTELKTKANNGRQILERLCPIHAKALRLAEEMKEAVHIVENKVRVELARSRSPGVT